MLYIYSGSLYILYIPAIVVVRVIVVGGKCTKQILHHHRIRDYDDVTSSGQEWNAEF